MFKRSTRRFSLRFKVMVSFFVVTFAILLLGNILYYLSDKALLQKQAIAQNKLISEQLDMDIKQSQMGQDYVNNLLGNELRLAALTVNEELPSRASEVKNQQLVRLAKLVGVSQITLLQKTSNDIVGVKSSDPKEIGLSTKNMGLWYKAFNDLLNGHPSASKFGQSWPHYWTGPFTNASSDPSKIDKFGYYYDGSKNYIIDPFVESSALTEYAKQVGAPSFISRVSHHDASVLSIAVLNKTFGKSPITYSYKGTRWVDVQNQPVMYGNYSFSNPNLDVATKNQALAKNVAVSKTDVVDGRKLLKTFVPETIGQTRYVVEVVADYNVVSRTLHAQLDYSLAISALLLFVLLGASYAASGFIVRPIQRITARVNQIADRDFGHPVGLRRTDEIGVLAEGIDVMAVNLMDYLHESLRKERGSGVNYLVMVTHALIHELRNPLVSMKYLVEFLPRVQPEISDKAHEVLQRMHVSTQYATSVVREFQDFLKNGKMNLRPENLMEVVENSLEVMAPMIEENGVRLEFRKDNGEDEIIADIDRDKMRMVIVNLIKNGLDAIAEAVRPGEIRVDIGSCRDGIYLDVTDNGVGIPVQEWESIFMPYRSTKKSGIGLGLSFSGFVVASHGGSLAVKSSSSEGSTLEMILPIVRETSAKFDEPL